MKRFQCIVLIIILLIVKANTQISNPDFIEIINKEIYILGTFHYPGHDFEKYPQDINTEIKRVVKYNPDIICVEVVHKSEEFDVYETSEIIDKWIQETNMDTINVSHSIDSLYKTVLKYPETIDSRFQLANFLYVTGDYANAFYQWFLIENANNEQSKLVQKLPESIIAQRLGFKKSETQIFAFKVAKELGHEKVYAIDYMHDKYVYGDYNYRFNQRLEKTYDTDISMESYKNLIKLTEQWLEDDRVNSTSTYYEKLNSKEYGNILFEVYYKNYFRFLNDANYSKWHELQLEKRNWKMFELLVQSVYKSDAQKVFVLIGATHKFYLERHLLESGAFKILKYNEI